MKKATGGVRGEFLPKPWADFLGEPAAFFMKDVEESLASKGDFYPEGGVFNAFDRCPPHAVKVVLFGQDPYHGKGQAHGLAFSVKHGVKIPPSLKNIVKELQQDLGVEWGRDGDLTFWAENGVLLLNSILTVSPGLPGSHAGCGWEVFTDYVLKTISERHPDVVFILWGALAKKKKMLLTPSAQVLLGAHPSPMSANRGGFFGGKYFSRANEWLKSKKITPVEWV